MYAITFGLDALRAYEVNIVDVIDIDEVDHRSRDRRPRFNRRDMRDESARRSNTKRSGAWCKHNSRSWKATK